MGFNSIHTHSDHSLKDGAQSVKQIVTRAKELDMSAVALTDHGRAGGLLKLRKECLKAGIKPVYGIEFYVAPLERTLKEKVEGHKVSYHLTVLAKNKTGLENLFTLGSLSWRDGYYYRPRIDNASLEQYKEGLIVLSGCGSSRTSYLFLEDREEEAYEYTKKLHGLFRDDFYIEVQNHGLDWQLPLKDKLLKLSEDLSIPAVATQDSHYQKREDAALHNKILKLAAGNLQFDSDHSWFKSDYEMKQMFKEEEYHSISRTQEVVDKVNCEWKTDKTIWPVIDLPKGETAFDKLQKDTYEGMKTRKLPNTNEYQERIRHELDVISKMGFETYFLVVADFINWGKKNNIRFGAGRGCLTGSTPVYTERGRTQKLAYLKVGDIIYSHTGSLRKITNTFKYDINETLLGIKIFYGDKENPIRLTKDHKVFGEKAILTERWNRCSLETQKSIKKYQEPKGIISEIPANELKLGDYIFFPVPQRRINTSPQSICLEDYITSNKYPCHKEEDKIIEQVPTNKRFKYSNRDINNATNVSRNAIRSFLNKTFTTKRHNPRQVSAHTKITEYVLKYYSSLEEWREDTYKKRYHLITIKDKIEFNNELMWIIGKWIADGWLRKDCSRTWGICFNTNETEQIDRVEKWLEQNHLEYYKNNHKEKALVQITVRSGLLCSLWSAFFPEYHYSSNTKTFPEFAKHLEEEKLLHLLKGYIDGDGHVSQGRVKATTVSLVLAEQLKFFLLSLHLPSSINSELRTETREEFKNSQKAYSINFPISGKLSQFWPNKQAKKQQAWRKTENGIFCQIRGIEELKGIKQVYDITVEKDSSYLTTSGAVHNSACGSLVCFLLGITEVDPIPYGLLFARFLQESRISLPDIDSDVDRNKRGQVLEYLADRYGEDKVAQIGTFSAFKPRGSLRSFARACEYDKLVGETLAKMVPPDVAGKALKWKEIRTAVPELFKTEYEDVVNFSQQAEGLVNNCGIHAAGVVIADRVIDKIVPLFRGKGEEIATQFDMENVEEIGLVKLDLLALKTLTVISDTVDLVKQVQDKDINVETIDLNDQNVYKNIFQRGELDGIFQFETSSGFRDLCVKVKPTSIMELADITSLFRPGPLGIGLVDKYVSGRQGEEPEYLVPELEPILKRTFGVLVYQEDIMQICVKVAGYTLTESDNFRRIIGKKKTEAMSGERIKFISGCVKNNIPKDKATELFEQLESFALYGFNACLTGDTTVQGQEEVISIEKIKGDLTENKKVILKSYNLETRETFYDECLKVIDTGIQETYKLTLSNGETEECTLEHKFFCTNGKMETVKQIISLDLDIVGI